jgi:hypothetical protein
MKNPMAPASALAIVLVAAAATAALRAAVRRPQPRPVPVTEPAPATVTAGEANRRPLRSPVRSTAPDTKSPGRQILRTGRPASLVEQMQRVFHELHADERNALCAVCDDWYGVGVMPAAI